MNLFPFEPSVMNYGRIDGKSLDTSVIKTMLSGYELVVFLGSETLYQKSGFTTRIQAHAAGESWLKKEEWI